MIVAVVLVASATVGSARLLQSPGAGAFAPVGARPDRGYFSQFPFERVDLVNLNLTLTFTDLVLPGNAGMDLRVSRTYRHQRKATDPAWTVSFTDVPIAVNLHTNEQMPAVFEPGLVMGDRSTKKLHNNIVAGYYITSDFWRFDSAARKVYLPDGRVATYQQTGDPYGGIPLQYVEDAFGNRISAYWVGTPIYEIDYVVQTVSGTNGTQTRTVDFNGLSFTYDGRTWTNSSTSAQPPVGSAWGYALADFENELDLTGSLTVTHPSGGTVRYDFAGEDGRSVVTSITTGGRAISSGTWLFAKQTGGGIRTATVTTPGGRTLTYKHEFWTGPDDTDWILFEQSLADGGPITTTQVLYEDTSFLIDKPLKAVKQRTIVQDGVTHTTIYSYSGSAPFKDYLRPHTSTEVASNHATTRIINRTFDYDFSAYIINRVESQTVTIGGQAFTSSAAHDNANGRPTSTTQLGVTTQFGYDGAGNASSVTDPLGHQVTSAYQWGVPSTVTSATSATQRTINGDGSVASETVAGATTSFTYDTAGRVTSAAPPAGAATTTSYAADGSSVTVARAGSWVITTVDGFGRPISTENSEGVRTFADYNNEGRRVFQSYPYTAGGPPGGTYTYDALGRVTTVTHVDGTYLAYQYNPGSIASRDENGRWTTQVLQAFGHPGNARVGAVVDPAGQVWSYSYNVFGSLTGVDGPEGPNRVWVYDANNRLVSETQPESGTKTFAYRADGLIESMTDAWGTTVYTYDGDHRLTQVNAPGTADDITIGYNASGTRQVASVSNGNETRFTYDAANRLIGREERVGGQIFNTAFEYDLRDNLIKITYPSNRVVQYAYDSANRVTRVYSGAQTYANNIAYHPSGARSALTFGSGTAESLTFDDRHRPYRLVTGAASDPVDLTYAFDGAGNVSSITDPRPGKSSGFSYDSLDRLESVTGFGANTFTYDALGNRKTKASPAVTYSYDGATNRLASASSSFGAPEAGTFEYDAVGNLTRYYHLASAVDTSFTYSPRQTMTSTTLNGATTAYTYDADGLRIQKASATGQQYYVRGLGGQLLAEYAALFAKSGPASGAMSTNSSQTLQWTPVIGATAYAYCVHTVNNNCAGVSWTWNGSATTATVTNLTPGTYYWQVFALTASGWKEADNGTWWSFTIYTSLFGKQGPPSGQSGLGSDVTLQWASLPDSGYWVCWDTTNNNSCDGMWWPNGGATTKLLQGLTPATYYWQVKADTPNGEVQADGGQWWSFTVGGGGGPSKLAPAPDLSGLSSNVLTQWTEVPGQGYSHCVDTSNNNVCDTMWWPNGGATSKLLTDLAPGTYYWQVKDTTGLEFNNGVWWSFTVGAPVTSFNKVTPGSGGILTTNNAPLSWTTAPGASFYETCVDTVNNHICDTSWVSAAQATTRTLTGLTDGTYYWQVRATTPTGNALADNGTWWSFTIDAPDPIREYIYLGGSLLASLTLTTPTPVLTYYHTDVLGSVRAITSATGAPLARHDYFPFGESTSPLTGDPRRFTGLERDAESAFDYASARYYRNVWGRFATADDTAFMDPGDPQTFNRYAYVLNNPLRWVDPSGHQSQEPPKYYSLTIGDPPKDCLWACGVDEDLARADSLWWFWFGDALRIRNNAPLPRGRVPLDEMAAQAGAVLGSPYFEAATTIPWFRIARVASPLARLGRYVGNQAGFQELLTGGGKIIAGPGSSVPLREAARLAGQYGGNADRWVKVTSTAVGEPQIHAYRNLDTNLTVEFKTKIRPD